MELKDLFEKKTKMVEEEYQETDKIKKFILGELKYINEDCFGEDNISNNWEVEIMEDEFSIYFKFGNIKFKEIVELSEIYKKHGFSLYYITDCFTWKEKEKGLVFGFRRTEDMESEE